MMASKIGLITSREYMTRVTKKSFILTTIITPLAMIALMIIPVVLMNLADDDSRTILVVDDTGIIAPSLSNTKEFSYVSVDEPLDSLLARDNIDGILAINDSVIAGTAPLRLYSNGATSISLEGNIVNQVNNLIEERRLKEYDIADLDKILEAVKSDVSITTIRTDRKDGDENASAFVSYGVGVLLTFILYMFLLLYGQMVMTSIIEEKNNRVLEIVVSSIKPTQLMLGKIMGIGLVALTQIVLWCGLLTLMSTLVFPMLMPAESMAELQQLQAGSLDITAYDSDDIEVLRALGMLGNVGYLLSIMGWMTLFLIGGFLFYSAINAAIGSAVDNIQDASQLQTLVVLPIIIGLVCSMTAAASPNSSLAFWMSIIPITSPMVMMARIPAGIPTWEILLSLAILVVSIYAMIWMAAKIYRVGIFMYGKKPTIKEMLKWIRYK
ncbi:MAG: ABC transporter permease [Muribaculaceae bacterium]|nr:ABC transporter permease [Muribaculaceae bacterium]